MPSSHHRQPAHSPRHLLPPGPKFQSASQLLQKRETTKQTHDSYPLLFWHYCFMYRPPPADLLSQSHHMHQKAGNAKQTRFAATLEKQNARQVQVAVGRAFYASDQNSKTAGHSGLSTLGLRPRTPNLKSAAQPPTASSFQFAAAPSPASFRKRDGLLIDQWDRCGPHGAHRTARASTGIKTPFHVSYGEGRPSRDGLPAIRLPQRVRFLPTNDPDPQTIERLQAGDTAALAAVFRLYGDRIYRLARRMSGSDADADDLTQDIFVRAFERAKTFRGESGLFTWIHTLAVHQCINHLRRRDRRRHVERLPHATPPLRLAPPDDAPDGQLVAAERAAAIQQALDRLPDGYRACFVLREVEGLPYTRIGELLNTPVGTVMSRLSRARRLLRERLRSTVLERSANGNNPPSSLVQSSEESARDELQ
jgi:RNA polymerase sigma-70 factor (ECF subfamily)